MNAWFNPHIKISCHYIFWDCGSLGFRGQGYSWNLGVGMSGVVGLNRHLTPVPESPPPLGLLHFLSWTLNSQLESCQWSLHPEVCGSLNPKQCVGSFRGQGSWVWLGHERSWNIALLTRGSSHSASLYGYVLHTIRVMNLTPLISIWVFFTHKNDMSKSQ